MDLEIQQGLMLILFLKSLDPKVIDDICLFPLSNL